MGGQLRLLLDAIVADKERIFGIESLAADPLFCHLAGGLVPSIDTLYRDLRHSDDESLVQLEELMFDHGAVGLHRSPPGVLVDIDSVATSSREPR